MKIELNASELLTIQLALINRKNFFQDLIPGADDVAKEVFEQLANEADELYKKLTS